jgi:hypothetical protein|tara:strand:- start:1781 stop:3058 length:1278 start_codon:yes stop_codon:yes gene_type:complete
MNKLKYTFLLFFTFSSGIIFSQISTNSPYSRFGLGNLNNSSSADQLGMGGSSVVYNNPDVINFNNPATYSSFKAKSFLFTTSLNSSASRFTTSNNIQYENNTSFSKIALGFPVNKYISVSSGLLPFSNVGYQLDYNDTENFLEDTVSISSIGNGGLSKYYLGASVKLHKTLSVGVNASYLFGGLSRNKTADFNNSSIFNVSSVNRTNITGVSFETGLLFNTDLSEDNNISFGLTYNHNANLNARRTLLGTTYELNNSLLVIKDTFQNEVENGTIVLPSKLSAGMMYSSEKWLLLANYSSQNWSDYSLTFGEEREDDNLENSVCVSSGLQYTPEFNSVTKYWKRINYRMGARYDKTYLSLKDLQLTEKSLSFGLGLPVKRSNSFYNIGMEVGKQGTTQDKLIQERFVRFTFGVTFKGLWFVKRKYD